MNVLILDAGNKSALELLNTTAPIYRQLQPAPLQDGREVLNADLLTDLGPGGTWNHYAELLAALPMEVVALEQFQGAELPS